MVTILIHGCVYCGVNGAMVRKIQRAYEGQVEVLNSRYDNAAKDEHIRLLKSANMATGEYQPIVVINGEVKGLRSWNS